MTGSSPPRSRSSATTVWAAAAAPPAAHRGGTLRVEISGTRPNALPLDWLADEAYSVSTFQTSSLRTTAWSRTGVWGRRRRDADRRAGHRRAGAEPRRAQLPLHAAARRALLGRARRSEPEDFRASMERFLRVTRDGCRPTTARSSAPRNACRIPRCDLSRGIETDARAGTITIHLSRPDGRSCLHKLTMPFAYVVPADPLVRKAARAPPPGTGPYRVERWDPDRGGVLVRNPYFQSWSPEARPAGFVDRIEVRARPKRIEAQIGDVRAGAGRGDGRERVHELVSPRRAGGARRDPERPAQRSFPGGTTNWMFLNVREPPFDDLDVRRAVNLATDRHLVRDRRRRRWPPRRASSCPPAPRLRALLPVHGRAGPGRGWSAPDVERARALIARSGRAGARVGVWCAGFPAARSEGYYALVLDGLGFRASCRRCP